MALTYRGNEGTDPGSASSWTTGSFSIGTASADRWVIVSVTVIYRNATAFPTVTVSGVSTTALGAIATANDVHTRFFLANVTTGTTCTVSIADPSNTPGAWWDAFVAVWTEDAGEPTLYAEAADTTQSSGVFSVSIDVDADGLLLALGRHGYDTSGGTYSGITERFDTAGVGSNYSGASDDGLSSQTGRTVSLTQGQTFDFENLLKVVSLSPPAGGSDALTLTGVSVTPTVGLASLGQTHALSGVPLVVNPTIGLATLGQAHGLTATGVSVATTVGDAVFGQVHALGGTGISVAPSVGVADLGQIHALSGEGVSVQPIVGLGSIIIGTVDLTLLGISVTPTVGVGALGQVHGLAGVGLEVQPLVGAGDIGQAHALTLTGVVVEARVGLGLLDPEPVDGYLVWHLENQVNAASKRYVPAWRRR